MAEDRSETADTVLDVPPAGTAAELPAAPPLAPAEPEAGATVPAPPDSPVSVFAPAEPEPLPVAAPEPADPRRAAFTDPRGAGAFDEALGPGDLAEMYRGARATFTELLKRAKTRPKPESKSGLLLLLDPQGGGKAHLLRDWRDEVHKSTGDYWGHVELTEDRHSAKSILEVLVTGLLSEDRAGAEHEPPLLRLAKRLLEAIDVVPAKERESFLAAIDPKVVAECIERFSILAIQIEHFAPLKDDVHLLRALLWLATEDLRYRPAVAQWLCCRDLSPYERDLLGGLVPRTSPEDPVNMIAALGRAVAVAGAHEGGDEGSALVIFIDEAQEVMAEGSEARAFQRLLDNLLGVVEKAPSTVVVLSCESSLEAAMSLLRDKQRLRVKDQRAVELPEELPLEELRAIAARRLKAFFQQVDPSVATEDDSIEPFDDAFLKRLQVRTPEALLKALEAHHKRCLSRGEWIDPTPAKVEKEPGPAPAPAAAPARTETVPPEAQPPASAVKAWLARRGRGAARLAGRLGVLRRGLVRWPLMLAITYALTWLTMWGINSWAANATRREFVENVRWLKSTDPKHAPVIATADLVKGGHLNPAPIGVNSADQLPNKLKVTPGAAWVKDERLSRAAHAELFTYEFEDPFDKFYAEYLGIPLQPMQREKKVREKKVGGEPGYAELLAGVEGDEREQMLRHFSNVYGEFMRMLPSRVIRWVNGWVQVTAFACFWLAVLIVVYQLAVHVGREWWLARRYFPFGGALADGTALAWDAPLAEVNRLTPGRVDRELEALDDPALGADPGAGVQMLREVYEAYLRGEVNSENVRDRAGAAAALKDATERLLKKVDSGMSSLVYLGWSLPSLGFIGTVLGLGTALLTAGDMVTPNSELQRDAIQTVSIYLGRAFDKTFVALLLSLVMMALVYGVRYAEEWVVLTCQERIARGVIPRLFL